MSIRVFRFLWVDRKRPDLPEEVEKTKVITFTLKRDQCWCECGPANKPSLLKDSPGL